jgi:hypothetical protein
MAKTKTTHKKSSKLASGNPAKKAIVPADPPIIVGGGGSTYIWMLKSIKPQLIDPSDANHPPPHANNYVCIVCDVNVQTIEADDGVAVGGNHKVKPVGDGNGKVDPSNHKTVFG